MSEKLKQADICGKCKHWRQMKWTSFGTGNGAMNGENIGYYCELKVVFTTMVAAGAAGVAPPVVQPIQWAANPVVVAPPGGFQAASNFNWVPNPAAIQVAPCAGGFLPPTTTKLSSVSFSDNSNSLDYTIPSKCPYQLEHILNGAKFDEINQSQS